MDRKFRPVYLLTMYGVKLFAIWVLLALIFDLPNPGIVEIAASDPQVGVFMMAFLLYAASSDAVKWHKHQYWGES